MLWRASGNACLQKYIRTCFPAQMAFSLNNCFLMIFKLRRRNRCDYAFNSSWILNLQKKKNLQEIERTAMMEQIKGLIGMRIMGWKIIGWVCWHCSFECRDSGSVEKQKEQSFTEGYKSRTWGEIFSWWLDEMADNVGVKPSWQKLPFKGQIPQFTVKEMHPREDASPCVTWTVVAAKADLWLLF